MLISVIITNRTAKPEFVSFWKKNVVKEGPDAMGNQ